MLASTLHGGIAKVRAIVVSGSAYNPLKTPRGRRCQHRQFRPLKVLLMKVGFGRCRACRLDFLRRAGRWSRRRPRELRFNGEALREDRASRLRIPEVTLQE